MTKNHDTGSGLRGGGRDAQVQGEQDADRRGAEGGVCSVQTGNCRGHQHREARNAGPQVSRATSLEHIFSCLFFKRLCEMGSLEQQERSRLR